MKPSRLPAAAPRGGRRVLGLLVASALAVGAAVLVTAAPSQGAGSSGRSGLLDAAKIAFSERNYSEAERLAREAGPQGRALLGSALLERGRLAQAREVFAGILKDDPRDYEALRGMGRTLTALGQAEMAIAFLRRACDVQDTAEAWKALGHAQRERGDALGALSAFQRSLALDREQADVSALLTELVTGKEGLAKGTPGPSRPGVGDPLNPRAIDPQSLVPAPRPPDPSQFFPKPQGRSR